MMWRKTLLFVQLGLFALAGFAGQACFEEHYYPAPGYGAGPPVIVGDYDGHHVWHDRDWWVGHDRDWVSAHHHEWLEPHDEREHRGG